ncbi:MAG: amidophosphoribosyltransferase [Bacteroidota bacterium]|nr:amidophosphoribosyltransferase [Bacteroidota bacterium]
MSDSIKHECGIALVRQLKPLRYYQEKYGSLFFGIYKMYLMLEKQHNRGQDGAGFASIKFDMNPGDSFISRVRSSQNQPIQDVFSKINDSINTVFQDLGNTDLTDLEIKQAYPYLGEIMMGHLRYGTFGNNSITSVHPFLRQNNWMHRNLVLAGNFNLTNVNELFDNLVTLGQHPKVKADTVTVMEKIGHFLDDEVIKEYKKLKKKGFSKQEASPMIAENIKVSKILKKATKNFDGGYVISGMLGHGDAFLMRDPNGIRPAYFFQNDEFVVAASERPAIQTVFNVPFEEIQEVLPGHSLIIKKNGRTSMKEILPARDLKACSFERIYFSRGNDAEIYNERKALGKHLFPKVQQAVDNDFENTVFSFIPNTAETAFYGLIESVQSYLKQQAIATLKASPAEADLEKLLNCTPRTEKVILKDVKLRTFITEDSSRDDLVAHVYDITYKTVKNSDNLIVIDDSIVRGTTLKKSILKILDRLSPKKIVVVSSAPQIRYPDCYGIDMARLEDLIAFQAMIGLLKDFNKEPMLETVYQAAKEEMKKPDTEAKNVVNVLYELFSTEQISAKIAALVKEESIQCGVDVIFQDVDKLHLACPKNLGDWYFTGDYPTPGGNRVANQAFINFMEGNKQRAY